MNDVHVSGGIANEEEPRRQPMIPTALDVLGEAIEQHGRALFTFSERISGSLAPEPPSQVPDHTPDKQVAMGMSMHAQRIQSLKDEVDRQTDFLLLLQRRRG